MPVDAQDDEKGLAALDPVVNPYTGCRFVPEWILRWYYQTEIAVSRYDAGEGVREIDSSGIRCRKSIRVQ